MELVHVLNLSGRLRVGFEPVGGGAAGFKIRVDEGMRVDRMLCYIFVHAIGMAL